MGEIKTIDFDTDADGNALTSSQFIDGEGLWSSWGATLTLINGGNTGGNPRRIFAFDTTVNGAMAPFGFYHPLAGQGLNLAVSRSNNQNPLQSRIWGPASGITVSWTWDRPVEILSYTVLDADVASRLTVVNGYADITATTLIATKTLPVSGNGVFETYNIANLPMTRRLDFVIREPITIAEIVYRECACGPGQFPDCEGVCDGPHITDCDGKCYDPGDSKPPNVCDCAGECHVNGTEPDSLPDCLGICGGDAVPDCLGICDGDALEDCDGICGGGSTIDCSGNCNQCVNASLKKVEEYLKGREVKLAESRLVDSAKPRHKDTKSWLARCGPDNCFISQHLNVQSIIIITLVILLILSLLKR